MMPAPLAALLGVGFELGLECRQFRKRRIRVRRFLARFPPLWTVAFMPRRTGALAFVALGPLWALLFSAMPPATAAMRPARDIGSLIGSLRPFSLGNRCRRRGAFAAGRLRRAHALLDSFASSRAVTRIAIVTSRPATPFRAAWPPNLDHLRFGVGRGSAGIRFCRGGGNCVFDRCRRGCYLRRLRSRARRRCRLR